MPELTEDLKHALAPARAALIVIDMQNDFCAPGGYIDRVMGKDVSAAALICPALERLIESARTAGVPVIWIGADYTPDRIPASMQRKLKARGITAICCEPGSWGADWFCVRPGTDEPVIIKHNYSGFAGTQLGSLLYGLGVTTLVFGGVQTQVCVESTVREAHALGYTAVVARDAVGSHSPKLHEASLMNMEFLFGEVLPVDDITSVWQPSQGVARQ